MKINKRNAGLPLICLVCGDVARGINFDLMTCMSCKAFFRRHAAKSEINSLTCQMHNQCEITLRTRGACSACRLKKCLRLGMNPHPIQRAAEKRSELQQLAFFQCKNLPLPKPVTTNDSDRTLLTSDDWKLLSNILNSYDTSEIIPSTESLLHKQSSLIPKLRAKHAIAFNFIKSLYLTMKPFVERSQFFGDLSRTNRLALVERNLEIAGAFNLIFLIRELNALDNLGLLTACQSIYGCDGYHCVHQLITQFEQNRALVKLMLLVLCFSSNCSIVTMEIRPSSHNANALVYVQNKLVTLLWKYLLYQYGFRGAVRRLDSMTRLILNILHKGLNSIYKIHSILIKSLIKETTLAIADERLECET